MSRGGDHSYASDAEYHALLDASDEAHSLPSRVPHTAVVTNPYQRHSRSSGEFETNVPPAHAAEAAAAVSEATAMGGTEGQDRRTNADKRGTRSTLYSVTGFIIVTEFCERLAYYGFAGSLVLLFQTELGMTNADADAQFALWSGVVYVMPLFGGWISDSYLGRYHSILVFSILYLIGLIVAASSCVPGRVSPLLLFPAIYLLALGTGGIKSSVSVFGADQFDEDNPKDAREKLSFFNWFYWSINLGALVSYTLVSYVCQYGVSFLGGEDWGFMVGYSIPCIAMALALVVFLAGTPRYRRLPPSGSILTRAVKIALDAAWTRRRVANQSTNAARDVAEGVPLPKWLQGASVNYGGLFPHEEVVGVSRVWRLLPFLALQVPYWAVYAQMSTAFQNQGCQMDLSVFGFDIPVAALNSFDTLAILCLIPVVDRGLYPWLRRIGWEPTMLRKIGAGLLLAGSAVLVAAWVEVVRRGDVGDGEGSVLSPCQRERDYDPEQFQDFWKTRGTSEKAYRPAYCSQVPGCNELRPDGALVLDCIDCEQPPLSSDLNIMWQVPQYLLIGASEILSSVTSLEFFYDEAPTTMRGVSAGLNLLTTALGSWVTIPLLRLVNSGIFGGAWVPHDLNRGHLDFYFCLLAALVVVSFGLFVIVANDYQYQGATAAAASPAYSSITDTASVESGQSGIAASQASHHHHLARGIADAQQDTLSRAHEEGHKLLPPARSAGSPTFGRI